MRIEVLYVPGCANYEPAVKRLQAVLESQSVQAEIHSVPISSDHQAKIVLFPGSPTIRIDGKDVEQQGPVTPSLACRLYANRSGLPSEESLRLAVSSVKRKE